MIRNRRLLVAFTLAVAIGVAALATGCSEPPKLTSAWPTADSERSIDQPKYPAKWPYTGKKAKSEAAIMRRPLSIKVENSVSARPQTALNSADVIYESIAEGGITRFNCIFHSTMPAIVGPVRSARMSDLWIVPQYDGLFVFSGASTPINREVNKAGLPNLSEDAGVSGPYSRSSARSAPHNLYVTPKKVYTAAKQRGMKVTASLEPLQFDRRSADASAPAVSEITVPFSPYQVTRWVYDPDTRMYRRYNGSTAANDAATGKPVVTDNVVVLWAKYTPFGSDKVGSVTYRVELGGKGRASIFRGGQRFDGTWVADRDAPPKFIGKDKRPLKLAQGRTWFQVVPLDGSITME